MTRAEFLKAVASNNITEEVKAYAKTKIANMETEKAKKKAEREPLREQLYTAMEEDVYTTVAEMKTKDIGIPKTLISSLFCDLEKQGKVKSAYIRIKGKNPVKGYKKVVKN